MAPSADHLMGGDSGNYSALGGAQLNSAGESAVARQVENMNKSDLDGAEVISARQGVSKGIVNVVLEKANGGRVRASLHQKEDYFKDSED